MLIIDFPNFLASDDAELPWIPSYFIVAISILFHHADELQIMRNDDHLQVLSFVELNQSS